MLKSNVINSCSHCELQYISPIFTVPKPNGKHRFILNLKQLNKFIETYHFKMEDHRTALKLLEHNYYMATIDLQDAYFFISVNEADRKMLRFEWNSNLYEFNVLPFGLCTAPYVFTKIIKPVVHYLRSMGLMSVNYLDDFMCIGRTYTECLENIKITKQFLESLGFVINISKSQLIPSTYCKFLGFNFDTHNMTLNLPQDKKIRIRDKAKKFIKLKKCTIRQFAEFIGLLTSACPAVQYGWVYTKIFEREKFLALNNTDNYNKQMILPSHLTTDLNWWATHIMSSFCPFRKQNYVKEIFSDSSLTGWGIVCGGESARGNWNESELSLHINTLELKAAFIGLKIFAAKLTNCELLLRIDNSTAICYINRMGGVQHTHLNNIARDIWQWCEVRGLFVFASYVKSSDNVADYGSRLINVDTEWELADYAFTQIENCFGILEFDLFASVQNAKYPRYSSWKHDPDAELIDAFTFSWQSLNFYAFPPFSLVARVLQKILSDKANGVLVVPMWPSQAWYPLWSRLIVSKKLVFQPSEHLLFSPFRNYHPLHANLTLVAARLSGNR
ncbi:hypothetical protein JYU34_017443 [Plutella xylostella]|uniref:Reverse transcriptase domain-containing protein n=1 Tax=Plutella xylostella TaxID=51655 RepID=A0ABQ7Q181_PLUXY|nr:hypothetical protein JYU34_017443 [Plutella xylostella]